MGLSERQLEVRSRGIGGSDAAAACGIDPWKSQLELYLEKTAVYEPTVTSLRRPNPRMEWGNLLEPVIRQKYMDVTGRKVSVPDTLFHPDYPHILVNLDGKADDDGILEVKTTRHDEGWGEPGTDEIPQHYLFQCHHALLVTGATFCDVAVLIAGSDFRLYHVAADPDFANDILEAELDFWSHVTRREPPDPDYGLPRTTELIRKLNPGTNGQRLVAGDMEASWRAAYEDAALRVKVYQNAADAAKQHLEWTMGDASELAFPDGRALRRRVVTRRGYTVEDSTHIDARWIKMTGSEED
jgi:putative phage-type endonuclease